MPELCQALVKRKSADSRHGLNNMPMQDMMNGLSTSMCLNKSLCKRLDKAVRFDENGYYTMTDQAMIRLAFWPKRHVLHKTVQA